MVVGGENARMSGDTGVAEVKGSVDVQGPVTGKESVMGCRSSPPTTVRTRAIDLLLMNLPSWSKLLSTTSAPRQLLELPVPELRAWAQLMSAVCEHICARARVYSRGSRYERNRRYH